MGTTFRPKDNNPRYRGYDRTSEPPHLPRWPGAMRWVIVGIVVGTVVTFILTR
jgi:hypothetical protein